MPAPISPQAVMGFVGCAGKARRVCLPNNVFGYYIEVRNTHKDKVPESWIRKQTLANAERYITEELKEYDLQNGILL